MGSGEACRATHLGPGMTTFQFFMDRALNRRFTHLTGAFLSDCVPVAGVFKASRIAAAVPRS